MNWGERCFESLPEHWRDWLESWCLEKSEGKRSRLMAYDFRSGSSVVLRFEDGSYAQFEGAFFAVHDDRQEIAVFTEHCGYHVFSTRMLEYSYREWARCPTVQAVDDVEE